MPCPLHFGSGDARKACRGLLHQHPIIQNTSGMNHPAQRFGRVRQQPGDIVSVRDIRLDHLNLSPLRLQLLNGSLLFRRRYPTSPGEEQVASAFCH